MISVNLPFVEGQNLRIGRSNKVQVETSYSSDGRSLEGVFIDYDPQETYSLFLLEHVLNSAEAVKSYSVYDENGSRITGFNQERFPKRV